MKLVVGLHAFASQVSVLILKENDKSEALQKRVSNISRKMLESMLVCKEKEKLSLNDGRTG